MPNKILLSAGIATLLAFIVIILGAYVRLSHAGLGCPDWPGCYGRLIMPLDAEASRSLDNTFIDHPVEHGKAWKEMTHRYAAGILGLLILYLAASAWIRRNTPGQPVIIPVCLLLLVIFQAALGMWTVTLLLKPVIVMGHLLGGMALLSLLFWLTLRYSYIDQRETSPDTTLWKWILTGLLMVVVQIALGGWTSANYAALACPDFPTCQGKWWPDMDFIEAFVLWRGLGIDYEGGVLAGDARTAIHMTHRIGALFTLLIVGSVAIKTAFSTSKIISRLGILLAVLLCIQISLGIANILKVLPLPVAVAHNGGAALLLLCLVALLNFVLPKKL